MRWRTSLTCACLVVACGLAAAPVGAQQTGEAPPAPPAPRGDSVAADVAAGRAAFEQARFDQAATAFDRVLHAPSASPGDLTEAHRYLAALRAAAGDPSAADAHVAAALAIDGRAAPPEGASPDLAARFQQVAAAQGGAPGGGRARVGVALPASLPAERAVAVRVTAAGVPASLGAHVALRCTADGVAVVALDLDATQPLNTVPLAGLAAGAAVRCTAALATHEGVVLDRAEAAGAVASEGTSHTGRYLTFIGVGVAVVTAVAVAVVLATAPSASAQLGAPRVVP